MAGDANSCLWQYIDIDIGPEFPHERPGEEDDGQDGAPVFAYEFAGTYEVPVVTATSDASPVSQAVLDEELDFDPADPTLERFPSNREEILDRVRTLETGLDEDVASFEGYPASPVVSPGRKSSIGSIDATGKIFSLSPSSPRQEASRRLDTNKRNTSRDSLDLDQSPSPSLHCIVEETATDDCRENLLPVTTGTESVSPKTTAAKPADAEPEQRPMIIVHRATEDENTKPVQAATPATDEHTGVSPEGDENSQHSGSAAESEPEDGGDTGNRALADNHQSTVIEAGKYTDWFTALSRLFFVDWLRGLLGVLFRWRR